MQGLASFNLAPLQSPHSRRWSLCPGPEVLFEVPPRVGLFGGLLTRLTEEVLS
jgi:hypothetical protein